MHVSFTDPAGVVLKRKVHLLLHCPDGDVIPCVGAEHCAAALRARGVEFQKSDCYNVLRGFKCQRAKSRLASAGYTIAHFDVNETSRT